MGNETNTQLSELLGVSVAHDHLENESEVLMIEAGHGINSLILDVLSEIAYSCRVQGHSYNPTVTIIRSLKDWRYYSNIFKDPSHVPMNDCFSEGRHNSVDITGSSQWTEITTYFHEMKFVDATSPEDILTALDNIDAHSNAPNIVFVDIFGSGKVSRMADIIDHNNHKNLLIMYGRAINIPVIFQHIPDNLTTIIHSRQYVGKNIDADNFMVKSTAKFNALMPIQADHSIITCTTATIREYHAIKESLNTQDQ